MVLSGEDVAGLLPHLAYELEMLIGTYEALLQHPFYAHVDAADAGDRWTRLSETERVTWNALHESFVVHLRCLGGFFFDDLDETESKHPEDVLVEHFFPEWGDRKPPHRGHVLALAVKKANGYVMHLSKRRIKAPPSEKMHGWDLKVLVCCLKPSLTKLREVAKKKGVDLGPLAPQIRRLEGLCDPPAPRQSQGLLARSTQPPGGAITMTHTIVVQPLYTADTRIRPDP